MTAVWIFIAAALLVAVVFVLIWLRDAQRTKREVTDPERLSQEPTHQREGE